MATLQQILLTPENQPHVIDDCLTLIHQEVSGKSGVSGTAVKLAYKTANTFASGYLRGMVEKLVPEMVGKLEPYWAEHPTLDTTPRERSEMLLKLADVLETKPEALFKPAKLPEVKRGRPPKKKPAE